MTTTSISSFEFLVSEVCKSSQLMHPEDQDKQSSMVESIGYRTGVALFERHTVHLGEQKQYTRFSDELDIIKYLCKDLWQLIFQKQVDNLKTNHKGMYVLVDNGHPFLDTIAPEYENHPTTSLLLWYCCGLIRGGLSSLGMQCSVTADITTIPACKFNVQVKHTKRSNATNIIN
eukprot:m.44917 g.44917  ORF g.44917 m.44917 type:complete len:174 (-) comp7192_c0_seq1:3906-4427(-)